MFTGKPVSSLSVAFYTFDLTNEENAYFGDFVGFFDINEKLDIIPTDEQKEFSIEYLSLFMEDIKQYATNNQYLLSPFKI